MTASSTHYALIPLSILYAYNLFLRSHLLLFRFNPVVETRASDVLFGEANK